MVMLVPCFLAVSCCCQLHELVPSRVGSHFPSTEVGLTGQTDVNGETGLASARSASD